MVRKVLFFVLFFVTLSLGVSFGIKGGYNISSWWGDDGYGVGLEYYTPYEDRIPNCGFDIGLFINQPLNVFSIQSELHFNKKGYAEKYSDYLMEYNYLINMYYIELTTLAKYRFPIKDKIYPNFYVGSFSSYLLGAKELCFDKDNLTPFQEEYIYSNSKEYGKQNLNIFDLGFCIGTGVDIKLKNNDYLLFDIRYSFGLIPIADECTNFAIINKDKNKTITFMVGYEFNGIKK